MENKYNIGDKVFIIYDSSVVEKEIVSIVTEDNNIKYRFEINSCGGINEDEIFSTNALAKLKLSELLKKAKFKVGDIVLVLRKSQYEKIREWNIESIDMIKDVKLDYNNKDIDYVLYKDYNSNGNIYSSTQIVSQDRIVKVEKQPIKELFEVGDLIDKLDSLESEYNKLSKELSYKEDKLEEYLSRKFVKRYNKLNGIFAKTLYKELFGD